MSVETTSLLVLASIATSGSDSKETVIDPFDVFREFSEPSDRPPEMDIEPLLVVASTHPEKSSTTMLPLLVSRSMHSRTPVTFIDPLLVRASIFEAGGTFKFI